MLGENIKYQIFICNNSYNELFKSFNCGIKDINDYLYKAYDKYTEGMGLTKIIVDLEKEKIIGYYVLNATTLMYDTINKDKIKGFPAVEIKIFALDMEYQGLSFSEEYEYGTFGDYLLSTIVAEIINLSENLLGVKFVKINAVPDAVSFWKRNGFNEYTKIMIDMFDSFNEDCIPMYMMIE